MMNENYSQILELLFPVRYLLQGELYLKMVHLINFLIYHNMRKAILLAIISIFTS